MLSNKINAWLLSQDDYEAGLLLLRETGFTGFTLSILSKGDDAYNRTRLEAELRKWVGLQNNVPKSDPAATRLSEFNSDSVVSNILTKPVQMPNILSPAEEPVAVTDIRKQIYRLMDERVDAKAFLRAKMELGNGDAAQAERMPYALKIKALTRQIDELYSQLDFFDEQGYLAPSAGDPAVIVDDTVALMNARSYVSKYKGKLRNKKITPEQAQKYEQLLKQYSDEKARLEAKLSKNLTPSNDEK